MSLHEIDTLTDLEIGSVVSYDLFNGNHQLMMAKGTTLDSYDQLEVLIEASLGQGIFYEVEDNTPDGIPTPTSKYDDKYLTPHTLKMMCNILQGACSHPKPETFVALITHIANTIMLICEENTDKSLGYMMALNRNKTHAYSIRHSVQTGVISYVVGKRMKWNRNRLLSTMCGALTANISMFDLQDELDNYSAPLGDNHKRQINAHPIASVRMLQEYGVTDKVWLSTVLQHHEELDGTGYPHQSKTDTIVKYARLVRLADIYCAKVDSRAYRNSMNPQDALKVLLKIKHPDKLEQAFIKELGVFPLGTIVKLDNGETGIVIKRNLKESTKPIVKTFLDAKNIPLTNCNMRDTRIKGLGIKCIVDIHNLPVAMDANMRPIPKIVEEV